MRDSLILSVVIPVFNERCNLREVLDRLHAVAKGISCELEVVFVDDGSTDGSWEEICVLRNLGGAHGNLKGLRFSRNFGKEAAILAGLQISQGEAVVVMDADLQHPPELISDMVAIWREGFVVDIVEAVKIRRQKEALFFRWAAWVYYGLFRFFCGIDIRNATDFKLLDRRAVEQYLRLPEVGRFFRGLTIWLGMHSVALEFEPPPRAHGSKSWTVGRLVGLARRSIVSFSSMPLRLVTWFGVLGLMFSIALTLQTLWLHWRGQSEEGFPTVIVLILGMGSMILLGIGIIGEYVAEIYTEVKRRPAYVVADRLRDE